MVFVHRQTIVQTLTYLPLFPDAAQALSALKTLGKHPTGAEVIAAPGNLSLLLALSLRNPELFSEAFRCVANTLLLIEKARVTWVDGIVGGGTACIELLEVSNELHETVLTPFLSLLDCRDQLHRSTYFSHRVSYFFVPPHIYAPVILFVPWWKNAVDPPSSKLSELNSAS
jgi:Guanine nucleotide exchange factor synembryn